MNTIKIPELPEALSFEGLVAYGVDTVKDQSVHIPLEFVKQGADAANEAAGSVEQAKKLAQQAAGSNNAAQVA